MLYKLLIITLSTFLYFMVGCSAQHERTNSEVVKNSALTFENVLNEVIRPYCIDCHSPSGKHDLYTNYNVVKSAQASILERINSQNASLIMPKGKVFPPEAKAKLEAWFAAGAPLDESTTSGGEVTTDIRFDFLDVSENVLGPSCVGCHSHYSDYQVVKASAGAILSEINRGTMPYPKKIGGVAEVLSDDQKAMVAAWIDDGLVYDKENLNTEPSMVPANDPTWVSLRNNVFGPKCIKCHNSTGPRGVGVFATHLQVREWLVKKPNMFLSENPDASRFVEAILGAGASFDTMPPDLFLPKDFRPIPAVTPEELAVIKTWIELGLPYDRQDLIGRSEK